MKKLTLLLIILSLVFAGAFVLVACDNDKNVADLSVLNSSIDSQILNEDDDSSDQSSDIEVIEDYNPRIKAVYDAYVRFANDSGEAPLLYEDWLESIKGADGKTPTIEINADGYWVINGEVSAYKAVGQDGKDGQNGQDGKDGRDGKDGINGQNGKDGKDGMNGKSAYELAVEKGYTGTIEEWLLSLVGEAGENGKDGKDGINGQDGKDGKDGAKGDQGISVVNAYVDENIHLFIVLSDGTKIDAGYIGVNITPNEKTYTVTFVDYDGTVLKIETVEEGQNATAPENPTRNGYDFIGWDKSFVNVGENITLTACYEQKIKNPTFIVDSVTTNAGEKGVAVTITLSNNPGISSIALSVSYDNTMLTLVDYIFNSSIGGQFTPYNSQASSTKLVWVNWTSNISGDWVFVTMYFDVSENANGEYSVSISYNDDDVYDVNENNISFDIIMGKITVN